jgi:heat shock protein HslJ
MISIFRIHKLLACFGKKFLFLFMVLFCFVEMLTAGCQSSPPPVRSSSTFDRVTFKSTRVPSGIVLLVNGEHREKFSAEDSEEIFVHLDNHMATGKIDQSDMAVAILVSDMGTGEIFYDLVLLKKTGSGWEQTNIVELGDRVKIQSVSILDEEIVVDLNIHGPYDRDCCSTLETVYRYHVNGNRMVKMPDPTEFSSALELAGPLWKWQETYYKNDTYVQCYDPNSYTIQLQERDGLKVRADCNLAGGSYAVDGEYIDFQISHSTMASCPPESLSEKFLEDLRSVYRFYFKNGKLYIVLKADVGVMVFFFE